MIVTKRDDISSGAEATISATGPADDMHPAGDDVDDNGMTRDDIFDQLEDENRVVTSGRGSRLPTTDSDGGTAPTGYSAGISSGSGAD
ncbi:MAG: hypothetical protein H7145_23355 [Akkermansiaceae bacterium]|nr:hypothetical protein [Armatimonadota bacterium]